MYAHVQFLFNGVPDLLDEFKQFLPDITGQPASALFDSISPTYYSSKRIGTPPPTNPSGGKKKRANNVSFYFSLKPFSNPLNFLQIRRTKRQNYIKRKM